MFRTVLVALAILGASDLAWADTSFRCRADSGETAYFVHPSPGYDHDRYGTTPRDQMFQFGGFISSFDSQDDDNGDGQPDFLAVPHWVAYEMKRYEEGPPYRIPTPSPARPTPWYEISALDYLGQQTGVTTTRIDLSYRGFGTSAGLPGFGVVNRGHLAAKVHVQRIGWKQACNTHVFVNAVPQQKEMNQGDWLFMEAYSGGAANKFGRIWVIAGPVFDHEEPLKFMSDDGEIPVAVPTAMFKVLIKESDTSSGMPDVLAFIFPQPSDQYVTCQKASSTGHTYDPTQYLTSIAEIEQRTGIEFFRNVKFNNSAQRDEFKAMVASEIWQVEEEFFGVRCGS